MIHLDAITFRQLRVLLAIVQAGNLAAAAKRLNVTAPAVSTQLRTLEANLGAPLLDRGPNGVVVPTRLGEEVLATARRIESTLRGCAERAAAIKAGRAGHVALGVVSTGKYFAPGLIARIRREHPGIELAFRIGNRGEIVGALGGGGVELAIMGRPPRDPRVVAEALGDHPHVLIAPPGHPLVGRTDLRPADLMRETFLSREAGSGTRMLMERFLSRLDLARAPEVFEIGTNESIKQAVMAGLGISLISGHTVGAELESGRLAVVAFPGLPVVRRWFLVHPEAEPPSPAAARLRAFILSLGGDFLPRLPG